MAKKRKICFIHGDITDLCNIIERLEFDNKVKDLKELKNNIAKIKQLVMIARNSGQAMENRLKVYSNGILDMGFKRVRDKK